MRKIRGGGNSAPQIVEGTDGTLAIDADGKPYNPTDPEATSGTGWEMGKSYLYLKGTGVIFDFSNVTNPVTVSVYIGDASTDTGNTIKGGTFNGNWVYVHRDNKLEDVTVNKGVGLYDTAQIVSGTYNGSASLRNSSKIISGTFKGNVSLGDTSEIVNGTFNGEIYMGDETVIDNCYMNGAQINSNYSAKPTVKGGVFECNTFALPNATISNITFKGSYLTAMQNGTVTDSVFIMDYSTASSYSTSTVTDCTIENSAFIGPFKFSGTNTIKDSIFLVDPTGQNVEGEVHSLQLSDPDKGIRSVYLDNDLGADFSNLIGSRYTSLPTGIWMVGTPKVVTTNSVKVTTINPITGIVGLEESEYTLSSDHYTVTLPFNKDITMVVHVLPLLSITDEGLPDCTNAYKNGDTYYGKGWEYRKLNEDDTEKTLIFTSNEYDKFDLKNKTINCPVLVKGVSLYTAPSFTKNVTFDGGSATSYSYGCNFLSSETNPLTITIKNGSSVKCSNDLECVTIELSENSSLSAGNFSNSTVNIGSGSTLTAKNFEKTTLNVWGTLSGSEYTECTIDLHNGSSFKAYDGWMTGVPSSTTVTAYEGSTIQDGFIYNLTLKGETGATEPVTLADGTFKNIKNESAQAGVLLKKGYVGQLDAGGFPVKQTGGAFQKRPTNLTADDEANIHAVKQYSDYSGRPEFYVNNASCADDLVKSEPNDFWYVSSQYGASENGERQGYVFTGVEVEASCRTAIMSVTTDPDVEGFSYSYTSNYTVTFTMPAADVHVNSFVMSGLRTDENGLPDYKNLTVTPYSANGHDAWKGDGWAYEWRSYGDNQEGYCVVVPSNNSCSNENSSSSTNQKLSCPLIVESDGSFSWSGTIEGPVYNSGSIGGYSSTYTGTVYNLDVPGKDEGGSIGNGKFTGTVYNGTANAATHNAVASGGTYSGSLVNYSTIKSGYSYLPICTGSVENHGTIAGGFYAGSVTDQSGTVKGGVFIQRQANGQNEKKVVLAQNTADTAGNHFTKTEYSYYVFPEDSNVQELYVYGGADLDLYFSNKITYKNGVSQRYGNTYIDLQGSTFQYADTVVLSGDAGLEIAADTYPEGTNSGNACAGGNSWYYVPNENGKTLYLNNSGSFNLSGTLAEDVTLQLGSATLDGTLTVNSPVYSTSSRSKINGGTFNGCFYPEDDAKIYGGTFNGGEDGIAVDINIKGVTKGYECWIYGGEFKGSLLITRYWSTYNIYNGTFDKSITSNTTYANAKVYGGTFKEPLVDSKLKGNVNYYNGFFMADTATDFSTNGGVTNVYGGFFAQKPTGTTKNNAVFYKISDENGYRFTLTDVYEAQTYANGNSETFTNAYTVKGTKVCVTTESKVTHVKVNDTVTPVADFLSANGGTTSTDGMTLTFTMPEGDVELQTVPIDWNCDIVLNEDGVPTTAGGNGWSYSEDDGLVIEPGYTADLSDADGGPHLVSVPVKAKDETGKTTTIKGGIFTNDVDLGGNKLEDSLVFGDITATNPVDSKELNVPANSKVNGVPCPGGTVKVIGDVLLKVEWPAGTTDQHWTAKDENDADLAAGDLLESGSFKDAEIDFKMGSHSKLTLALEDNPPPVLDYAITVTLPEDDDLANLTAADVVKVKVGGSTAQRASAGDLVELSFEAGVLPAESTKQFVEWKVTDAYGDVTVKNADHMQASFGMPAGDVTVTFTLKGANDPNHDSDDKPAGGDGTGEGVAVVLGVAAAGGVAYAAGTQIWLETHLPDGVIPTNREQLALILWKQADKPAPQSSALYTDMAAADTDGQQAARWCVEQGLMKDFNDGEIFKPGDYVFRPQVIKAWCDLQDLLNADAEQ